MVSALEQAIDALSDPDVQPSDAFRRLLVVARRIRANDMASWILRELEGFEVAEDLPEYRQMPSPPLRLTFDGYGGRRDTMTVSAVDLPAEIRAELAKFALLQPLAELVALANADADAGTGLSMSWVQSYRDRIRNKGDVPHITMMTLNEARIAIPKTYLRGVLDRVRNKALELALAIEDVSPQVGSVGGPTVESDAQLRHQVHVHLTNVGAGATLTASVAAGDASTSQLNDLETLDAILGTIRELVADDQAVTDFEAAVREDGGAAGAKVAAWLTRVQAGAYGLAGGVTSNAAYEALKFSIDQWTP